MLKSTLEPVHCFYAFGCLLRDCLSFLYTENYHKDSYYDGSLYGDPTTCSALVDYYDSKLFLTSEGTDCPINFTVPRRILCQFWNNLK